MLGEQSCSKHRIALQVGEPKEFVSVALTSKTYFEVFLEAQHICVSSVWEPLFYLSTTIAE